MRRLLCALGTLSCFLLLAVPLTAGKKRTSANWQEMNVRKYNKFYLEAVCQKALEHYAAQHELLMHALKYCPEEPEAVFELAMLQSQNP